MATSTIPIEYDFTRWRILQSGSNLNSLTSESDNGLFYIRSGVSNSPSNWCILLNLVSPMGIIVQIIYDQLSGTQTYIFVRKRLADNSWMAWNRVALSSY